MAFGGRTLSVIESLWAREFSVCVHARDFERYTFTKLLVNQWSAKSHTSTPDGLCDLPQAQDLPEPP